MQNGCYKTRHPLHQTGFPEMRPVPGICSYQSWQIRVTVEIQAAKINTGILMDSFIPGVLALIKECESVSTTKCFGLVIRLAQASSCPDLDIERASSFISDCFIYLTLLLCCEFLPRSPIFEQEQARSRFLSVAALSPRQVLL